MNAISSRRAGGVSPLILNALNPIRTSNRILCDSLNTCGRFFVKILLVVSRRTTTKNQGAYAPRSREEALRFLVCVMVFVGLGASNLFAAERGQRERTFVRALELFDSAKSPDDYRESAKLFESILADGFRSGAVYYNAGNAWYRAGEHGRAILNYRKAQPYRPRDPYLAANLEQAIVAAPGRLAETPRPWWSHVLFWTNWLSYPTKIRILFATLSLAAVMLTMAFFLRNSRLNVATVSLLLLAIAIGIDIGLCYGDIVHPNLAVITGETIARKGTGMSYEPAFDQPLRDGAEFHVLNETADWTFGHFENIGDGWVRNEFVAR